MEYLNGKTLAEILQEGASFPEKDAAAIAGKLAWALQYVHNHGVIHRDLKPANVLLLNIDVKLLDFGVAHIIEFKEIKEDTQITGTFGYMSPEATGILNRMVDERSDLYSLGVILYRLLTGQLPFKEKALSETIVDFNLHRGLKPHGWVYNALCATHKPLRAIGPKRK
jgi:serine/threonine protein kinase